MGRSFLLARRRRRGGKRELRVERDARHVGAQGERRPGEREKRWLGHADTARPRGEDRTSEEERDDELEKRHGSTLPRGSMPQRPSATGPETSGRQIPVQNQLARDSTR